MPQLYVISRLPPRGYRLTLTALALISTPAHAKPPETAPAYCQLLDQLPAGTREGYLAAFQNYFNGKPIATKAQYDEEMKLIEAFDTVPPELDHQIKKAFGDAHPDWRQEEDRLLDDKELRRASGQVILLKHHTRMRALMQRHCTPKIG